MSKAMKRISPQGDSILAAALHVKAWRLPGFSYFHGTSQ
jgi:hypothetical protein